MDTGSWYGKNVAILYEIIREMNERLDLQQVLKTMLTRLVEDLGYRAATLRLLDQERLHLELAASYGLSKEYLEKGLVDLNKSGLDQRVLAGGPEAMVDLSQESGFQYREAAAREGLASVLAIPLVVLGKNLGVLHLYTAEKHAFSDEEISFIGAIANLGAQVIQRSRLFEAFRRIAHHVNSSLELEEVLGTLLKESVDQLNVRAGSIRLLGPKRETLHLAAAYGLSEKYLQKGVVKVAESPIDQQVLGDLKPVALNDLEQQAGFQYPKEAQEEGIRSVLVLALQVMGTPIGVMRLYSGKVRQFNEEETSFARAVSDLGAVAIENAKLLEAMKQRLDALKQDADGWYRFLAFS